MLGNVPFAELITFTRASAGWRFNASGILVQDGNNVPRYDYDPLTLQPRGMLVEEARTNLVTHSSNFSDASWPKTGCSVSGDAALAPDGTSTADKIVEDTSTGSHAVVRNVTVSASTTYSYSVFVKAAERTVAMVQLGNFGNQVASNTVYINLSTGAFTATDVSRTVVSSVGNGWWRVATTVTTTSSGTTLAPSVYAVQTMGTSSYAGDGSSGIYTWGAQLEAGAFPTSFIPTTSSTVARASDVATISDLSKVGFNALQGSFVVEAEGFQPNAKYAFAVTDGTTNNMIGLSRQSTSILQSRVTTGGVVASLGLSSSYAGERVKVGMTYGQGVHESCLNGGTVLSIASGVPVVNQMRVGAVGTTGQIGGWLRSIRYYPRRLSNAELQALTA